MSMTDRPALSLPSWVIPSQPRQAAVDNHTIQIRTQWWREAVSTRRLPGAPLTTSTLSRAEVWGPTDDVFTLLWRTLAWGSGRYLRQSARRLDSIAADVPRAEQLLDRARDESRHDPSGAYALLRPGQRNEIRWLGPSFFTKFLYFAGAGAPDHPCLILDRRVATALRGHSGWTSLHRTGPWPAETYGRYCTLLASWARNIDCSPDELERVLFDGPRKEES
jgi:hypothetical protein